MPKMIKVRAPATSSTATTVAVSILPIGRQQLAQGQYQPFGHAHDGIGHRISKIGAHQLKQQPQHEGEQQQPQQHVDDISDRFHVYSRVKSAY